MVFVQQKKHLATSSTGTPFDLAHVVVHIDLTDEPSVPIIAMIASVPITAVIGFSCHFKWSEKFGLAPGQFEVWASAE